MAWEPDAGTSNTISGGMQFGPIFQGQDLRVTLRPAAAPPVALAQLPPRVDGFTGRGDELQTITGLLDPAATAGTVVVSAVAGLAGVGKTALAIAAGHAVRERGWYPGGVLFIDLHGYDESKVEPGQALDALLRALGFPAEHIPPGTEERCGRYRSLLAQTNKPVLVIADNASSEAQVRPLQPAAGPHRMVVTSRHTLAALDARLLDLTVLDDKASVRLLDKALRAARPDDDRISSNRETAERLAAICGGLPLALQIVSALLKVDPTITVDEVADDLAAEQGRLEQLQYDDGGGVGKPSVAAAFELSYRQLDKTSAQVFRLLPLDHGPDVSTATVAVLTGVPFRQARKVLADLAQAHLIEVSPYATGRWRMHDLLRLYAQRLCDENAQAAQREQARDRLLNYYLDMARAAYDHLQALPGTKVPKMFTDRGEALRWLDAERPNLVAAVDIAACTGRDQIAMWLPINLAPYFDWRRRFDDLLTTTVVSLDTARRLGDRGNEAAALINLGSALLRMGRFEEAISICQDAAAIFREAGDRRREGQVLNNLGLALQNVGRLEQAISVCQDAAAIFREAGDRHGEGRALNNLGITLHLMERLEQAISVCQDAAAIFREAGDRHGEGRALNTLGNVLRETGRFEQAITACQGAVDAYRKANDVLGEGGALNTLGNALRDAGRFEQAIAAHQDAVEALLDAGAGHSAEIAQGNVESDRIAQQT